MRNYENLSAIYEPELQQFLLEFGLWDEFRMGLLQCTQCATNVGLENLYGFTMREGRVPGPICQKPECVKAALSDNPTSSYNHPKSTAHKRTTLEQ